MPRISGLSPGNVIAATDRFVAVETTGVGPVTKTGSQLRDWAGVAASDPLELAQYSGQSDCTTALQSAIDQCFGPADNTHGRFNSFLNRPLILPPGYFKITSPLNLTNVQGSRIQGAHRFATVIENTAGGSIFVTNGFEYSYVGGMALLTSGTDPLFDLNWDGSSGGNLVALQSNTFQDMHFQGGANGLLIGNDGYQGSETLLLNCFFNGHSVAGVHLCNFNALQLTIVGGNIAGCQHGIWVEYGSAPGLQSVGFQLQTGFDIKIDNAANGDGYSIVGCRSESPNFIHAGNGPHLSINGCTHTGLTNGVFLEGGHATIDSCTSVRGIITSSQFVTNQIRNSHFYRPDYLDTYLGSILVDGRSPLKEIFGNYTLGFGDRLFSRIESNSASATSVTVPTNVFDVGAEVSVTQIGAGQVTLVEAGRQNLLAHPDDLTNVAWGSFHVTRTVSAIQAPDGVSFMDQLAAAAGTLANLFNVSGLTYAVGTTYTASAHFQRTNHNYVYISMASDTANQYVCAVFDLSTTPPTMTEHHQGSAGGIFVSASVADAGGGIYRLILTGSHNGSGMYFVMGFAGTATGNIFDNDGNALSSGFSGTETVLAGDVQLESGSSATAFSLPVTIHTPRSLTTRAQYSTVLIRQRALNDWVASGDLT